MDTSEFWLDWFIEAYEWIDSQPCLNSTFLEATVYRADANPVDFHPSLLKYFKDPLPNPLACFHGRSLQCQYDLLAGSYREDVHMYYNLVSPTTIPVKRFADLFVYMNQPPERSIFDFRSVDGFAGGQKHQQWVVLRQSHAKILLEHPEEWVAKEKWYERDNNKTDGGWVATPDEYLLGNALRNFLGKERFAEEVDDFRPFPSKRSADYKAFTFTYWDEPPLFGLVEDPGYIPYTFLVTRVSVMEQLIKKEPEAFFARKFKRNARIDLDDTVYTTQKVPAGRTVKLSDWMREMLYPKSSIVHSRVLDDVTGVTA